MKSIFAALIFFICISLSNAQFKSVGLVAGAGITAIDVQNTLEYALSNWNNYSFVIKGYVEYELKGGSLIGGELGTNRLYYWEYPVPGYSWYNWRTEWTTNLVIYFSKYFNDKFFIKTGAGLHIFHDGTVPGLLIGAGYALSISDNFVIPLGLRIEPIFGTATPIAINLASGIKYTFK